MKHYLSAILGFSIWGTFAFVLKPLGAFQAMDILVHRVAFAAVSILIACFVFRRQQTRSSIQYLKDISGPERTKLLVNVLVSALMLALNWFIFIYVMNSVSVNATSLAYLICPILTTLLAAVFLHEKLSRGQWIAVVISGISCIILAYGHFMDMLYSMAIALTYAIYLVLQKNRFQLDKFFTLTIHIVVSTFLLLPLYGVIEPSVPKTPIFYTLVGVIAIVYTIIPLFLNIYALKKLDSSVVATLLFLNPIISFLLAVLYYNESINVAQIIGFSLIFLAVIVFNVSYFYVRKRNIARVVQE